MFSACSELEEIVLPDCIGEYGTNEGGNIHTFENCTSLKKITLSKNAKVIPAKGHSYYTVSRVDSSCTEKGKEVDCCSNCGKEVTKELPTKGHLYSASHYPATVLAPETVVARCTVCGHEEKTETGSKLPATISVNTDSITLKVKQATTKVQVSNLAVGDAIKSWTSSNTKIVKVTDSGKIIAQKKLEQPTLSLHC